MTITKHTFSEMLDMIKSNVLLGHKIIDSEDSGYSYLAKLEKRIIKEEKFCNYKLPPFYRITATAFGLENALDHGKTPIILNSIRGGKGIATRIEDMGEGFNFKRIQEKYLKEEKYFRNRGKGFKAYNRNNGLVSFENKGKTLNTLYFFNQKDLEQKLGEVEK